MRKQLIFSWLLIRRLLLMLGVYALFRLLFLLFNYHSFSGNPFSQILLSFIVGLRFDISAIVYVNAIFMLLLLLPFNFRFAKGYQLLLKWIFFITNFIALFFALVDLRWYGFAEKRMTFDIFETTGDMIDLLPVYIKDYWYLLVIFAAVIVITLFCYNKIRFQSDKTKLNFFAQTGILLVFAGLAVTGARGGWQYKPIIPIAAADFVNASLVPLATNTPFNIILSSQSSGIKPVKYFEEEELKKYFSIQRANHVTPDSIRHENVMIIVWESLSRFFMGSLNGYEGYTPFLDSLAKEGLLCTNATANAYRSVEGIPAVTASMPTLMEESFIISNYQQNKILGLPAILKPFGYASGFFLGARNGCLNLDHFASASGYEKYYGMDEYPDQNDFDGSWGIWDEPYFQYMVKEVSSMQEPFQATLFTCTSHHPFKVPKQYESVLKKEENQYSQVMRYTDYSLKKFFESASKQSWYSNTLFVIVADHGAHYDSPLCNTPRGSSSIPVIFYKPDGSLKGVFDKPAQQTDILPSIIDYLKIPARYVSFGESVFKEDSIRYVYNYLNGIYHIEDNQYHLEFNGTKTLSLYDYVSDPLFQKNIIGTLPDTQQRLENKLKAVIQTYNSALINNKLMPE